MTVTTKKDGGLRKPTTGGIIIGSDYDTERTRKMKADADMAEIALARAKGELCVTADVIKAWENVLHACKAKLLSMPSKVSPVLANETEISQVKHLLEEAIRETLAELSNYQPEVDASKTGLGASREEAKEVKPRFTSKPNGRPKKIDKILS